MEIKRNKIEEKIRRAKGRLAIMKPYLTEKGRELLEENIGDIERRFQAEWK